MNTYKIYAPDGSFICVTRIAEVADLCGVSRKAAAAVFTAKVTTFGQFTVITY